MIINPIQSGNKIFENWSVKDRIAFSALLIAFFGLIATCYAAFKKGDQPSKSDKAIEIEGVRSKKGKLTATDGTGKGASIRKTDVYGDIDVTTHPPNKDLDPKVSPLENHPGASASLKDVKVGRDLNIDQSHYHTEIIQKSIEGPPLQLPPKPDHFSGRQEELKELLSYIKPGQVVSICGPGGMGKSALSAVAVWTLIKENPDKPPIFPDGVVLCDFYANPSSNNALEHIASAFGGEAKPTPLDGARKALSGHKALLLLEGTENTDNLSNILSIIGNCGVMITSRKKKDAVDKKIDLTPLSPENALKVLKSWGKTFVKDDDIAQKICEWIGQLPLAIRLVGQYLSQTEQYETEYFEYLQETGLSALDFENRQHQSIPLLLERSLERIISKHDHTQAVLSVIGFLSLTSFDKRIM